MTDARYIALPLISRYHCLDPTNRDISGLHCINKELNQIQDWLLVNKLTLNVDKTKFMIFHNRQRKVEGLIPKIKINCKEIERVSTFNFLGLTIDENVNWHAHTLKIANRISRTLGIMNRIKNFVPAHVLRIIYNSLILPHLQYSILAWGFYADRLFKLQKRAMRIITNSKYHAHTPKSLINILCLLLILAYHSTQYEAYSGQYYN